MLPDPDIIRALLAVCLLGMFVLAVFFLRGRRLSRRGMILWGLLALCIPGIGPFLVILACPGQSRTMTFA